MAGKIEKEISNIVSELMNDYRKQRNTDKVDMANQPQKKYVVALLDKKRRISPKPILKRVKALGTGIPLCSYISPQ